MALLPNPTSGEEETTYGTPKDEPRFLDNLGMA
jgi:hypothetical protein